VANIRFCYSNNWSLAATTLAASSAATGLPATKTKDPDRTAVWRSLSQTADQYISADLGAAAAATCCAIVNPRLQNSGSMKLQASTDGVSWSDVGTFGTADSQTRIAVLFFTSLSRRYWRVYSTNGNGAVADYCELGYVMLGAFVEPSANVRVPVSVELVDPSIVDRSLDGQATVTQRTAYRMISLDFGEVPQADLQIVDALVAAVGSRLPFITVLDTDLTWQAWYARIGGGGSAGRTSAASVKRINTFLAYWSIGLVLEEAR
jgi:hypothetical protein